MNGEDRVEELSHQFLSSLSLEKGYAENTLIAYRNDLKEFRSFCQSKLTSPLQASSQDLQEYLARMRRRGMAQRSMARKLTTVKQFYRFLLQEKAISSDPSELLSISVKSRTLPKLLTTKEMVSLIEAATGATDEEVRDRALMELWYATGCRISELTMLSADAIDFKSGIIKIRGKGDRERLIPVHKAALRWCAKYKDIRHEWLRESGVKEPKIFFLKRTGSAFTRQSMWQLVKKYAKRAKIKRNIWPHMIRHTFATHVLKGGADLRAVQELLGHRSISTTEVYTHLDIDNLKSMQLKYHPRS